MMVINYLKNRKGKSLGYGGCKICGDSWSWKEGFTIPTGNGSGVFPFCEECNKTATTEQKHEAIESLNRIWMRTPQYYGEDERNKIAAAHKFIDESVDTSEKRIKEPGQ